MSAPGIFRHPPLQGTGGAFGDIQRIDHTVAVYVTRQDIPDRDVCLSAAQEDRFLGCVVAGHDFERYAVFAERRRVGYLKGQRRGACRFSVTSVALSKRNKPADGLRVALPNSSPATALSSVIAPFG